MSVKTGRSAVLLLAHGTPDVLGEMAEYLGKVTGGRALPQEVVEELQHRYRADWIRRNAGSRASAADKVDADSGDVCWNGPWIAHGGSGDSETRVYVGMRNWHPYIADVIAQMRLDGVTHIKAICLAPQNSRTSVGLYRKAVLAAAARDGGGFRRRMGRASTARPGICRDACGPCGRWRAHSRGGACRCCLRRTAFPAERS